MTIPDEVIREAVRRYHRESDRYLKLCARVAEICRHEIVEGNAIRAQVTFRAKSPKSLEGKLKRFAASGKKVMPTVDSVFEQIRDLSAVRIATYEQRHELQVVDLVCRRFVDQKGNRPVPEHKDKQREDPQNFYRASHIETFLAASDVVGTYSNVADVPCEIQVCSMMSHVWNEIEHDLGYKPLTGKLSDQERNSLLLLGYAVRQGDITIGSLFSETERRQREQGGQFTDVYDFVARVRAFFPGTDFGRHAGALFEALQPLRLNTPEGIRRLLGADPPFTDRAQQIIDGWSAGLLSRGETRYSLDRTSSDVLLVLLLPKIARHLATSSADSVTDGAGRVRWLSERWSDPAPAPAEG